MNKDRIAEIRKMCEAYRREPNTPGLKRGMVNAVPELLGEIERLLAISGEPIPVVPTISSTEIETYSSIQGELEQVKAERDEAIIIITNIPCQENSRETCKSCLLYPIYEACCLDTSILTEIRTRLEESK